MKIKYKMLEDHTIENHKDKVLHEILLDFFIKLGMGVESDGAYYTLYSKPGDERFIHVFKHKEEGYIQMNDCSVEKEEIKLHYPFSRNTLLHTLKEFYDQ